MNTSKKYGIKVGTMWVKGVNSSFYDWQGLAKVVLTYKPKPWTALGSIDEVAMVVGGTVVELTNYREVAPATKSNWFEF